MAISPVLPRRERWVHGNVLPLPTARAIGVVAMGIINLSVVGMGLLAVGVNTMGVWTAGPMSMGLVRLGEKNSTKGHHDHSHHGGGQTSAPEALMAYPTREQAEAVAESVGCKGARPLRISSSSISVTPLGASCQRVSINGAVT